jgi:hypothetical protein
MRRRKKGLLASKPAWFAVVSRATPIVFGLRRAVRSGAKSLTSSPSHCARDIIVNSIVTGMKLGGGINSVSIQSKQRERCGLKPTRKPRTNSWAEPAQEERDVEIAAPIMDL